MQALREHYGLDKPVIVQYLTQLGHVLQLDFGTSFNTGAPVAQSIATAFPETAKLAALALLISALLGTALALIATYVQFPALRQFLLILPAAGVAVPGFWIGLMLLWLFSFTVPVFPAMGNKGFASMVLPAIALSVPTSATIAQILSRSISQEWSSAYVQTAEAKGLHRAYIQIRHVLRNASIPVVTVFAMTVGSLLAGAVVAETIFSRNGIGRLTQIAVTNRDVPVVQAVVILSAAIYALVNLATDLLYTRIDPRISATTGRRGR